MKPHHTNKNKQKHIILNNPQTKPTPSFSFCMSMNMSSADVIACHLTACEHYLFAAIPRGELLKWMKPERKRLAANMLRSIVRYNNVYMWLLSSLLVAPDVDTRNRLARKMLAVGEKCAQLNNFTTSRYGRETCMFFWGGLK